MNKYRWHLVELQKKINKIEETDADYRNNKKWRKYRNQQNQIYKLIREYNEVSNER